MLALHQLRAARGRPAPASAPSTTWAPGHQVQFVAGMVDKGSSPEGIAWFLGDS